MSRRKANTLSMTALHALLGDVRALIESAHHRTTAMVNSELTLLFWRIGRRIHTEVLTRERAGYGEEIVPTLAAQLVRAISQLPIVDECVAAAIVENAFQQQTMHQIQRYMIFSMAHTKRLWKFDFELGDDTHPPPDGGQWFAYVNRSTGKVKLVPGR
jgi:DUF1016 N-terminal domain